MKKIFLVYYLVVSIIMVQAFGMCEVFAQNTDENLTILFTHDMHDHLLPIKVEENGQGAACGGYARLQTVINEERKKDPNLLLVDGGDFSMGTLFQSTFASDAPELRIMGQMGYDATTFGNHEYDFRADGLANSLNAARKSGDKVPQIVQSNVSFPKDKNGHLTKSLMNLKQAMNEYGVKDYTIIKRNGIKIGIFGLMGKDAAFDAPMSEVKFTDAIENSKRVVNILKQKENVDIVICLSHSGTSKDKSKSEDEILAKKVDGIDVIISGHTHTKLNKPILVGNTIIGSCGQYGENLGVINISRHLNEKWKLKNYSLKPINDDIESNAKIADTIEGFKKIVQEKYLDNFDMKFDEVVANSIFNFTPTSSIGVKHSEDTLGNLISDAYVYAVKKAEGEKYEEIAAAVVPSGTIRGSFVKGNITVSDVFNVSSLGIGRDKLAGYPLVSAYLTGKELKTVCEVDASISPIMPAAQLYMSGLKFTFNPNRLILNKVTDAKLQKADGTFEEINDKKLYRVVVGLYSAQMLSVVGEKSHGILSIVPKNKNGTPITNFENQIIKDTSNGRNNEVKEWLATAEYLKSFDKVNGVPQYYNKLQGRKIIDDNHNILALFSHPNSIAIVAYTSGIAIAAIIIFIIVMIATRKKRRERRIKINS